MMKTCCNEALVMPSSYVVMNEEEMMEVEGGSWKTELLKKIGNAVFDVVVERGINYLIKNRKKVWKAFLKGLKPTDRTKATPYYQIFSNTCNKY